MMCRISVGGVCEVDMGCSGVGVVIGCVFGVMFNWLKLHDGSGMAMDDR